MERNLICLATCLALSSLLLRADDHGEHASPTEAAQSEFQTPPARSAAEVKTAKPTSHGPTPTAPDVDRDADRELARTSKPNPAPPAVVPRADSAKKAIKTPAKPNKESLLLNSPISDSIPIGGVARHQSGTKKDHN